MERSSEIINLGITNRRLHDLTRISITGRMALSLISTTTSHMNLSEQALSSIGRLLVYIQKKLLPTTPFPLSFSRKSK